MDYEQALNINISITKYIMALIKAKHSKKNIIRLDWGFCSGRIFYIFRGFVEGFRLVTHITIKTIRNE